MSFPAAEKIANLESRLRTSCQSMWFVALISRVCWQNLKAWSNALSTLSRPDASRWASTPSETNLPSEKVSQSTTS